MSSIELTEHDVEALVVEWYRKLDVHAPVEEVLPLLADKGLEVQLPEGTLRGHDEFVSWYETVTRRFFDETHTLRDVKVRTDGRRADVNLVVNWQARIWNPPDPTSQWLGFDAAQTWVVERAGAVGRPVITRYVVDSLTPMEGSASL